MKHKRHSIGDRRVSIRQRIANWLLDGLEPMAIAGHIDFADAESAFLSSGQRTIGLTQSRALALRVESNEPGPAFYWTPLKAEKVATFLRRYLIARQASHLWTAQAVDDFQEFLRAGANPVPQGAQIRI